MLWRARFPPIITSSLVSFERPQGTITNSDLELAGTIAHQDILAHEADVREQTLAILCDNTPAVAWQSKGSTTTAGAAAYLLRLSRLHQRHHRYLARYDHIPGTANVMADDCSRLWHFSDSQLLSYFNTAYPQERSWTMCSLRPALASGLTSALLRQRLPPESFLSDKTLRPTHGDCGKATANHW
ncbi:MAG: hypothetical protein ACREBR_03895, partial [bacterium]